jgi:threonine aldolase
VDDHARARKLADGLKLIPGVILDSETPATNMVFLSLLPELKLDASEAFEKLTRKGVLADVTGPRSFRLVVHYWINDAGVEQTISAFRATVG